MKSLPMTRVLVFAVTLTAIRVADARPFAIDGHGAMCQPIGDPSSVTYSAAGVQSTADNVTVICPLNAIALLNDAYPSVKVVLKMYTTGSMTCTFYAKSDGSGTQQAPVNPTPYTYTSTPIAPVDQPVCPDNDSGRPVMVSLSCTMSRNSTIGSIQVETTAYTPGAPSSSPMATTTGDN